MNINDKEKESYLNSLKEYNQQLENSVLKWLLLLVIIITGVFATINYLQSQDINVNMYRETASQNRQVQQ